MSHGAVHRELKAALQMLNTQSGLQWDGVGGACLREGSPTQTALASDPAEIRARTQPSQASPPLPALPTRSDICKVLYSL